MIFKGYLKKGFISVLFCMLVMGFPSPARAHSVHVSAFVQGDTCFVEGYFNRSMKAQGALVEVFDLEGQKLLEGRTDDHGSFSFKIPKQSGLRMTLTTSMGHKNELTLSTEQIRAGSVDEKHQAYSHGKMITEAEPQKTDCIHPDQMYDLLDQALDEKLRPLYAMVARLEQKDGISAIQVIGGIGYIAGLFGLALYIASRKKQG